MDPACRLRSVNVHNRRTPSTYSMLGAMFTHSYNGFNLTHTVAPITSRYTTILSVGISV